MNVGVTSGPNREETEGSTTKPKSHDKTHVKTPPKFDQESVRNLVLEKMKEYIKKRRTKI